MQNIRFIQSFKPGVPKRYLLFLAGLVWTFAGGMLLFKGIYVLCFNTGFLWLKVLISALGGGLFYRLLFSKISTKHVRRIINLKSESPCLFSFFNIKSYILMILMISSGILLRKLGIVPPEYLSLFYITMGIPLLFSAFRFYYSGIFYR